MDIIPEQSLREKEARIKAGLDNAFKKGEREGVQELAKAFRDAETPAQFLSRAEKDGVKFDRRGDAAQFKPKGGKVFTGWTPPVTRKDPAGT